MASSKVELIYFPMHVGRALGPRVALLLSGMDFDYTVKTREEWMEMKSAGKAPFGQLPIMITETGQTLAQSLAILSYIGDKAGLTPEDPLARAKVMSLCFAIDDMMVMFGRTFHMEEAEKKTTREKIQNEDYPAKFKYIDDFIGKHGKSGYSYGDKFTIADCVIFHMATFLKCKNFDYLKENQLAPFANISKVVETTGSNPKVKAFVDANMKDQL
eukprot:CAMPEP_0113845568 /NCGR_PEP_ID=MMETSP0372-20130328/829_1 /TAXON_ID=340204 /ORGANISM="Lankesteria abbotti" /LENGTH=214 /DNA_ID=CAMNT_0000814625 /DNA_START=101 /DNA_END=745 /DNA_ORIENTATION=- /assembly_acc=CAM_ASM_000359